MNPTHPEVSVASPQRAEGRGGTGRKRAGNRGPAAAAENHAALIASARKLFAAQGFHVPLTAIAQDAGVGQAVLYRHFPSRIDLALAVFDQNLKRVKGAVERVPARELRFAVAWRELVGLTVSDVAFIETVVESVRDPRVEALHEQLNAFLGPLLEEAQKNGTASQETTLDAMFMALRAAYGLVVTRPSTDVSARTEVEMLLERLGVPSA